VGEVPIAVVLADDHVVVRHGLRMLLEQNPTTEVVGEAGDADAALEATAAARPDVLLLDLNMPGRPSLEMLGDLQAAAPGVGVVVLTMEKDPAMARRAVELGARGYVLKQAVEEELVAAIEAVAGGGSHLSPEIEAALRRPEEPSGPPDGLTGREAQVLALAALGHTNPEIAEQLGISVRTVESHRTHIQQKTMVSSRPELVRYALDHGLI
jgi:two-component system response regulator NreC